MASARLVKFAVLVNSGIPPTVAARQAGYSESYARSRAATDIRRQAEEAGLIAITEQEALDAAAIIREEVMGENGDTLRALVRAMVNKGKEEDVAAFRALLDRLMGLPKQTVEASGPGGGPIVLNWPEHGDADDS